MSNHHPKIKEVASKIVAEYQPLKIILFGSYVWGKPCLDSDVDLLIVKKSRKNQFNRERDLRRKLFGNNFPPLDLLIYTPSEVEKRLSLGDFFIQDIFCRGKVLYAKK